MSHVTVLRAVLTAGCLVLLGSVSACSGDATAGDRPPTIGGSPTASPSAAAGVNPVGERTPPVPALPTDTEQNRQAFATYVVSAYRHAIRTNDAGPIMAVAATEPEVRCALCEGFADESRTLAGQDRYVPDLQITVDKVFLANRLDNGVMEYYVNTHASRAVEKTRAGKPGKVYPANDMLVFDVGMRWHDGGYELTGLKAGV